MGIFYCDKKAIGNLDMLSWDLREFVKVIEPLVPREDEL